MREQTPHSSFNALVQLCDIICVLLLRNYVYFTKLLLLILNVSSREILHTSERKSLHGKSCHFSSRVV